MRPPAHLSHLRTDRVGRPVPYINVWQDTHDRQGAWRIAYDCNVREISAYYDDEPDGAPDFRRQSIQRQRECVIRGLCQVCARPVRWHDRRLVISSSSVEMVDVEGGGRVAVVSEPWLCPECAEFAVGICPALIRRTHADELHVVPVTSPRECQLVLSRGWIDGPLEMATKANPVAMWAKIRLRIYTIQEATR